MSVLKNVQCFLLILGWSILQKESRLGEILHWYVNCQLFSQNEALIVKSNQLCFHTSHYILLLLNYPIYLLISTDGDFILLRWHPFYFLKYLSPALILTSLLGNVISWVMFWAHIFFCLGSPVVKIYLLIEMLCTSLFTMLFRKTLLKLKIQCTGIKKVISCLYPHPPFCLPSFHPLPRKEISCESLFFSSDTSLLICNIYLLPSHAS